MVKRKVIHVKGLTHDNPIPIAVKIENMLYTSSIIGYNPETGELPDKVEKEVEYIFNYIKEILREAEGTTEDIAHFRVSVTDRKYKEVVNVQWLKMFPDQNNRPARHTVVRDLKKGVRIQIEIVAVL